MVNNEYKNDLLKEKYILALHPHGLIPIATGVNLSLSPESKNIYNNFYKNLYNNLYAGTATFNYFFPILREFYLLIGTVDCSRPNLTNYLNNNKSIALFIGGARESIYCGKGKTTLILNRRNGFLKLALETGTSIIPVFTFGENDRFTSFTFKNNIIFELFHRLTGLWMPIIKYNLFESNIISVIGEPIHVEKNINYNENDILMLKEKYKNNLNTLFKKFKHKHENYIDRSLIII
jgi:2-acylglycerol O-acyltransferase 2